MASENELKMATRLARAIASDISIYYGEKIQTGLENDNLFTVLKEELEEGYNLFRKRTSNEIVENTNTLEKAIIDIIIADRSHIRTKIF